jgi:hypothetical protein
MAGGEDFRSHVPAGLGPFIVLLGQHGTDEADDGVAAGKDAHDVGPPADLLVQTARVVAPDLAPDLAREGGEGQDVVAGVVQVRGGLRELRLQGRHDLGVLGANRGCAGLLEDGPHQGGHPRLRGLGHLG